METSPLLDIEGGLEKVGPHGLPVKTTLKRTTVEEGYAVLSDVGDELAYFPSESEAKKYIADHPDQKYADKPILWLGDADHEIDDKTTKWLQPQEDGSRSEVNKLERTNAVDITESRPMEEVTLDGKKALGTSIPREAVDKYATDSVYSEWSDEAWALKLAEYLEKNKLACLYPFTFGGFKIYACTAYPVRVEGKLYLLVHYNTGEIILTHPLTGEAVAQEQPQKRVILVAPRLKKKQPAAIT